MTMSSLTKDLQTEFQKECLALVWLDRRRVLGVRAVSRPGLVLAKYRA